MKVRDLSVRHQATATAAAVAVGALVLGLSGTAPALAADTPTVTVSGTITMHGSPVPGADVEVMDWYTDDDVWETVAHGSADADGHYAIEVDSGAYPHTYTVGATGGTPESSLWTFYGGTVRDWDARLLKVTPGSAVTADVELIAGASVAGTVVDDHGKPVKGANVVASNLDRVGEVAGTTDATGAYELDGLPAGPVVVSAPGAQTVTSTRTVTAVQGSTVQVGRISIHQGSTITGRIKATRPYDQKVVLLDTKWRQVRTGTPDRSGNVRFTGLPHGAYRVVLSGTNVSKRVVVSASSTASFGTIERANRKKLSGTVRTPSGKPLAHADVAVTDAYGTRSGTATTDSKGRFSVIWVLGGTYTVTASRPSAGYATGTKTVKATGHQDVTGVVVSTHTGGTVSGVVKNAHGEPVEGVYVRAASATDRTLQVQTDDHGRWTLTGLGKGKWTVGFEDWYPGGYRNASRSATVTAGKTTTLSVTLH
ncbi:collagen binding domain-containing protein [Cellulomonas sp. HZM]|uniref:MSCRAMM family protein n=1 Tax=Cellulomonas sp. HZM TaxID=1454010 RepID=UPI00049308D7|nr:carboxypeptidase-like regulatory domain-containing protein [Cellulomonas sp. HZM]